MNPNGFYTMKTMISLLRSYTFLLMIFTGMGCASDSPSTPTKEVSTMSPNTVLLTAEQIGKLNIQTVQVSQNNTGIPVVVQGKAMPDRRGMGVVSAPISGRILRLYAYEGEMVRKGQMVAELESLEFATLAAEYLQSETELRYRNQEWERLSALYEKNLVAQSEVQRVEADKMRATTQLRAAETKLTATGISRAYLNQWAARKVQTPTLPIYAPVSGMIQNHNVQIGQSVMAYGQMMDIVPTQSIMVEAFVSPEQASSIRQGEEATLYMQGQPEVVRMTVTAIQAHMDETRHAVRVLLESQTLNGFPKPGQLVQVSFVGLNNGFATQVPLSAIEYEGDDAYVFVWKSSKQYERRAVKIIRLLEDMALISEGLNSGESVAVSEVFSLKALSRMAEFSE